MSLESFGILNTKAKTTFEKQGPYLVFFYLDQVGIRKGNIRKLLLKILSKMHFSKLRYVINTYMWNWYGMEYKYFCIALK